MGMERVVACPTGVPPWAAIRDRLSAAGAAVQMRMIDNLPAFPDEDPPGDWRELRVSLGSGMLTLRRDADRLHVVVWGNADAGLVRDQETLARACAEAAGYIHRRTACRTKSPRSPGGSGSGLPRNRRSARQVANPAM